MNTTSNPISNSVLYVLSMLHSLFLLFRSLAKDDDVVPERSGYAKLWVSH